MPKELILKVCRKCSLPLPLSYRNHLTTRSVIWKVAPMDKQNISGNEFSPEKQEEVVNFFTNELSLLSKKSIENIQKKLNFLCLELDPYNALELSTEEENILEEFQLKDYLSNPFEFTNIVLQLLNMTELELKKRLN
jgi:hypothetical protein